MTLTAYDSNDRHRRTLPSMKEQDSMNNFRGLAATALTMLLATQTSIQSAQATETAENALLGSWPKENAYAGSNFQAQSPYQNVGETHPSSVVPFWVTAAIALGGTILSLTAEVYDRANCQGSLSIELATTAVRQCTYGEVGSVRYPVRIKCHPCRRR